MQKKYYSFILASILLSPVFTFASTHTNKNACNKENAAAVQASIVNYLDKNPGLHSQDVTILKMRCADQYASAILHPKKPVTDDATVYLHKNKQWEVLSIGTDFDQNLLKQIPKSIRTY